MNGIWTQLFQMTHNWSISSKAPAVAQLLHEYLYCAHRMSDDWIPHSSISRLNFKLDDTVQILAVKPKVEMS